MAKMPRGEPRSVPDAAGELYDREMARLKAERLSGARWVGSPARLEAQDALEATPADFHDAPIVGPGLDAYEAFQAGRPVAGVANALLALGDVALMYTGGGIVAAAERGTAKNVGPGRSRTGAITRPS